MLGIIVFCNTTQNNPISHYLKGGINAMQKKLSVRVFAVMLLF